MSRTYCIAHMRFIDVSALSDADVSTSFNQNIGNIGLLQSEVSQKAYGTMELNQFVLDGSKEIIPDTPNDIAFWSNTKSNSECSFTTNPTIEIIFEEQHSCAGVTLYFVDEYLAELKITWYTLDGNKIESKTFYPDELIYVCRNQVENFGKIKIEFVKTSFPERYVKLQYILYGLDISWKDDLVSKAKVQEEVDLTSGTLSINTADISIVDVNNDFDIGNENGSWKSVQKTQEITLTEYKDGELIPAGTFFIDKSSFSENIASFSLIDTIGLMDQYTFYDGEIYTNAKAGVILEKIFACAGIVKYEISDDVYNILLSGYLKIQKCRAALQMVCFACGAIADDSRSDIVKVYKPDRYVKHTVGTDRKFSGKTKVALDKYVSGVSIECSKYELADKSSKIYEGTLAKGKNTITFSSPFNPSSVTVTAGTIVEVSTNYVVIDMPSAGTCTVNGIKYEESKFSYQKNVSIMPSGETENVKKFSSVTLYNTDLLSDNAQYLLDYFSLRKEVDMNYLINLEQVGNWVNIKDAKGQTATTVIEKQTLDLTGGFIADASCRGYSIVVTENYYTGTELYTGGSILL